MGLKIVLLEDSPNDKDPGLGRGLCHCAGELLLSGLIAPCSRCSGSATPRLHRASP